MSRLRTWAFETVDRMVDGLPPERRLRVRLAADAIARFAGGRPITMLDAGCGDAPLARLLAGAHRGWTIAGVDYDEPILERARMLARAEGLTNLELRHADLTQPLDERYDAIASIEVLTEVPDDRAVVATLAEALAPGGLLVLSSMDRDWRPVLAGSSDTWVREVRHGYARDELAELVGATGLSVTRVRPIFKTVVRLAEELSDRVHRGRLRKRAPLYPLCVAAAELERRGLAAGTARGWLLEARRS